MALEQLPRGLLSPPSEFGPMPFWFWNDDLEEAEILRQIGDFRNHGVGGFVIHPRVGLPRRLGWMSDALLSFYRLAIEEARRLGLRVMLYDEGMYPSGSSSGQVVSCDPAFACRCLARAELDGNGDPMLSPGENLVAIVERADGRKMAVIDRPAKTRIRGLHYIGEGPEEDEPPAADILNPRAVGAFIDLVHEKFYQNFEEHFGRTIVAIFTDEPGLLGRGAPIGAVAGTSGILSHVERILGYDFTPRLPALWDDEEPGAAAARSDYARALSLRLEETYYRPLAAWCEAHGVALTGHPSKGDDIGALRHFHIPGQDAVWRWILPDQPSALEGPESTQAKCAFSAMLHRGRRRNANECCGAYGHGLTWDEMNWLSSWGFARGLNLVIPHAFYYSTRGIRRDERPPDVGPHSPWWDRFPDYARAVASLSWLNTDSRQLCSIAILGRSDWLPWRAAKECYRNQRDFNYLEERDLFEARVDAQGLRIAGMDYRALIVEEDPARGAWERLKPFREAGGCFQYDGTVAGAQALMAWLDARLPKEFLVDPPCPALRLRHVLKGGARYLILFNEERAPLDFGLSGPGAGPGLLFEPLTGNTEPFPIGGRLRLGSHELKVLRFRPRAEGEA